MVKHISQPWATYAASPHQAAVDAAQAQIRAELDAGKRSLFKPPPPGPGRSGSVLDQRVAEELDYVIRHLEQLGDILAADPVLLNRHATQLQSIDLMQQILGHLGRVVVADDKAMAVERITLTELKARLKRKALRGIGE